MNTITDTKKAFLGRGKMMLSPCGRGIRSKELQDFNNNERKVGGWKNFHTSHTPTCTPPCTPPLEVSPTEMRSSPFQFMYSDSSNTEECGFCCRPSGSIVCRACGHTFEGRVRSTCNFHPSVIHLMDYEACPNCKAYQLKEFASAAPLSPRGRFQ